MEKEKLLDMYRQMLMIRKFETKVKELFAEKRIAGHGGLYIGQEAVAVGACANLRQDDFITSTHRSHGHCLAKGTGMKRMMAEIFEKQTGSCKGKGGSMHIADMDNGILGANGIVGGGLAMAPGAALSAKLRGTDQVTICFFGDGASNQTTFHEGINLASVWDLPVVYVCENNKYGLSLHQSKHQRVTSVADRAVAYGIPGAKTDGNDVLAVYRTINQAVARARAGKGPTLIEAETYLWRGHSEQAGTSYRDEDEVKQWQQRCPVLRLGRYLIEGQMVSQHDIDDIERQIDVLVDEAVRFAEESPLPTPEEAMTDVYA